MLSSSSGMENVWITSDMSTFGVYDCHYGENQVFHVVGDKFCITLPDNDNTCVALYGEPTPMPTLEPTNKPTNRPTPSPTPEPEGVCRKWCGDHASPWEGSIG